MISFTLMRDYRGSPQAHDAEELNRLFVSSNLLEGLEQTDPLLHQYILMQCHKVLPILRQIPDAFGEYTDHGLQHSRRVHELGESLLAEVELNSWEIGVFTLACFYHDIGMACPRDSWGELEQTEAFRNEAGLIREFVLPSARLISDDPGVVRGQTITEYLRRHHGERGRRWIVDRRPDTEQDSIIDGVYLWNHVGRVSIGHTLDSSQIETDSTFNRKSPVGTAQDIDVLLLTCLLRLADICHLSRDRALPHLREKLHFTSRFSERIWQALGDMAGVTCDGRRAVIVVGGEPRDFEAHRMIHEAMMTIRSELANTHRLLAGGERSLPWKFVDSAQVRPAPDATYEFVEKGRFRLDEDKIVRLLMGSRLYSEPLYALRESAQNALDAISVVRLKQPSFEGIIVIRVADSADDRTLEIFDNGTGMDRQVIIDHLLAAGSRPFVNSERRAREWGELGEGSSIIARHGIGFLSCFMIADKVEVFTLYKGGSPEWIRIDSPTRNIEFCRARVDGFPTWGELDLGIQTPWQAGHGTCVRLHLSSDLEMTKEKLMEFIAANLPRIRAQCFVVYNEDSARLRENWRTTLERQSRDDEATLADLASELFGNDQRRLSLFDGPPMDPALEQRMVESAGIRGIVTLSPARGQNGSVFTQDGILVRDGASNLWSIGRPSHHAEPPFDFNIDVRDNLQLELDAERARIVDTRENTERCRLICNWIEEQGLASLAAVESSVFFPCGGPYYHGGRDLLQEHNSPILYFHSALAEWYIPAILRETVEWLGESSFLSAKLYTTLGQARNRPVSINDLEDVNPCLLVLAPAWANLITDDTVFDDEPDFEEIEPQEDRTAQALVEPLLEELRGYASLEHVLLVSDCREFFALPLLCRYSIVSREGLFSGNALLIRLRRREAWQIPEADELEEFSLAFRTIRNPT